MINIFQPCLGKEELDEVEKVFESNWIGKGTWVSQFEKGFADHLKADSNHFTSTTCCTEGIFLAADIFNFNENDEVIVPTISFVSVGSSVIAKNAKLVLCDVDPRTLNATADLIAPKITSKTKALILNHYGGVPCDMDPIRELCRQHGIIIVEDSACAVRSFYKGSACGTMGDMGFWSFDAMKTICLGDGGMIYLRDPNLVRIARESLYLGLPQRQKSGLDSSAEGSTNWWEFQIERPGRRAIMNNITAAIGLVQLQKLDQFIARRKQIFDIYMRELGNLSWITLPPPLNNDVISSYYFFWLQLEYRDELAKYLFDNNIYSTFRYWPLHKVDFYNAATNELKNADRASRITLNIPLHQSLTDGDVARIIDMIKEFGQRV